ncbi:Glucose/arabinose dehydrogenase, beta-propeller fold [Williamsia serinedens]|uniref:Glucose/arabinose dehydrogenase, beta-propeller fold n=1 Tax=Williamsia serinedens TaxID=391736 RepID=A0ABT1H1R9_9NOCA|nr:Glucose/arabinose dehydrogenase, beta-propeller fold [Williamsia serinedens]
MAVLAGTVEGVNRSRIARYSPVVAAVVAALTMSACGADATDDRDESSRTDAAPTPSSSSAGDDSIRVRDEMTGLDHPWDVVLDPGGAIVTGERSGRIMVRQNDGRVGEVRADGLDVRARGEGGLMGMALANDFATSRSVYTCYASTAGDVRLVRWTAAPDWSSMTRAQDVLTGIPLNASGRHSGCRVLPAPDGTLFVATGDTASPTASQDLRSLGGKVLHVNADGSPAAGTLPGTPIHSFGHRNPQGLAFVPGTDRLYTSEHGPTVDDEVNLEQPRANYGWDPDTGSGSYDESVPMTDTRKFPTAVPSVWSSGDPTLAVADIEVLGPVWGKYRGMLAVAALKAQRLMLLRLSPDGRSTTERVDLLQGTEGRLRSITTAPDGSLLVTTDNGDGADKVLRVSAA